MQYIDNSRNNQRRLIVNGDNLLVEHFASVLVKQSHTAVQRTDQAALTVTGEAHTSDRL